jgi:predicted murein hydrolase (TIGR00659 family)
VEKLFPLWVYLQTSPLLGLVATLLAYRVGQEVNRAAGGHALANPVLVAVVLLGLLLRISGISYGTYFQGAQYVHFLLGPATVALALPMYGNLGRIRRSIRGIAPALLAGSLTAAVSAMLLARLLGAPRVLVLTLLPKSVTTPIAMGIAEQVGGLPSLAAICVILTGLVAAITVKPTMRLVGVTDWRAVGLAAGTAGHGIATAQVLLLSETAGAFGGLAIGLNGVLTAMLAPLLATLLGG